MRKPMVTRSFETMEYTVLCLNLGTMVPFEKVVTLGRKYEDKKLDKVLRTMVDTDEEKFVAIKGVKTVTKLLGMSEEEFIAHAIELDLETRKPIDGTDEDEDEDQE